MFVLPMSKAACTRIYQLYCNQYFKVFSCLYATIILSESQILQNPLASFSKLSFPFHDCLVTFTFHILQHFIIVLWLNRSGWWHPCSWVSKNDLDIGRWGGVGGCGWGARDARPPSPNSFIFMQFSAKNLQNNRLAHPLWELSPPSGKSWIRHCSRWMTSDNFEQY